MLAKNVVADDANNAKRAKEARAYENTLDFRAEAMHECHINCTERREQMLKPELIVAIVERTRCADNRIRYNSGTRACGQANVKANLEKPIVLFAHHHK